MLKGIGSSIPLLLVVLVGCTMFPKEVMPLRVHDIHINGQNSINPVELYAVVGEEIRWHNDLSVPVYLGFLGVHPMQQAGCERGFKTWYGAMKDIVRIPAGQYVACVFSSLESSSTISGQISRPRPFDESNGGHSPRRSGMMARGLFATLMEQ